MRELTSTTAAEAAQIAAGEGSALGGDVWRRACAAGSLSEAAWKVLDGNEPLLARMVCDWSITEDEIDRFIEVAKG